jgi:hypothetical protein
MNDAGGFVSEYHRTGEDIFADATALPTEEGQDVNFREV